MHLTRVEGIKIQFFNCLKKGKKSQNCLMRLLENVELSLLSSLGILDSELEKKINIPKICCWLWSLDESVSDRPKN